MESKSPRAITKHQASLPRVRFWQIVIGLAIVGIILQTTIGGSSITTLIALILFFLIGAKAIAVLFKMTSYLLLIFVGGFILLVWLITFMGGQFK